ncbi:uncharacterized protein LOC115769910 [Drosophila novamexicana]|uniref:uncharacterized protein LOC115769910 n=1 Tax=Drosophila novamexicana TaxID=47314 RepID=UPI0011E60368|nr:uncharacterized protein LOC115769910 [Drosophila novamexicana]
MRKFLIFVALCAVCTAAPAPADITETESDTVRAIPAIWREPAAKSTGLEAVLVESTKPKRESPAKPAHDEPAVPEPLIPLIEPADNKSARHQRDIPVPTQVKTTAAPNEEQEKTTAVEDVNAHVPEEGSSARPLLVYPVPISEVLNKPKTTAEPSSSSSGGSGGSSEESEEIKT